MALSGIFTSTADFYVYIDRDSLKAYIFNRGYLLGFIALYSIAIALTDWRKTERYKRSFNKVKDE